VRRRCGLRQITLATCFCFQFFFIFNPHSRL